ncbi:MAG TPA: 5-(carboxyamino)imidazole ribonucleotide mutase [Syntrophomonadaceae bacterium]|nr:5-(carboxyamino)imidazole ribonucleotide mutase [Syntrophomonadaceae bacterium]
MPKVAIVMGSDSDLSIMKESGDLLDKFGVDYEYVISSAHRLPVQTAEYAKSARDRGVKIIIAGAGGAAHLPGVIAAYTILPVIGVPIKTSTLQGVDSLYSIVQMPKGIPVATVSINGAANAALLAIAMLALENQTLAGALDDYRMRMADEVSAKDQRLKTQGVVAYLKEKGGQA